MHIFLAKLRKKLDLLLHVVMNNVNANMNSLITMNNVNILNNIKKYMSAFHAQKFQCF